MSEQGFFFEEDEIEHEGEPDPKAEHAPVVYDPPLYKKWFKTRTQAGVFSVTGAFEIGKVAVDIGEIRDGKLASSSKAWCDAPRLLAYLRAVANGTAGHAYPASERDKLPTPESIAFFGGSRVDGKPVSRLLKVHYWDNNPAAFDWRAGIFEANVSGTGAFIPDTSKVISQNRIMIQRAEMHELATRLDLALHSYCSRNPDWLRNWQSRRD